MRSVFLVNVQDMYAKTVSLFKGAVTQVARVLPVALVNTPCVLEVLVAVIFIGEYFATTVTSEAVSTC